MHRFTGRYLTALVAPVALLAFTRTRLVGQEARHSTVQLSGFAGTYIPTSDQARERNLRDALRRGSLTWGARLNFWASEAVGVEFTGGYSPARISVVSTLGTFPRSTDLFFGSGKLVVNLTPGSTGFNFYVSGGLSALHTAKAATDPQVKATDIGGVGGVGVQLPLFGGLRIRGDVEDYFYGGNFGRGNKFTNDFVFTGGLVVMF